MLDAMHPASSPFAPQTPSRLDDIAEKLGGVAEIIQVLSDGTETPFLEAMCLAVKPILSIIQNLKSNKTNCINLLERVNQVLCAVISMHLVPAPSLHSAQLVEMGRIVKTLHAVFTLLETQRDASRIKRFFKQGEDAAMFKACNVNLGDIPRALEMQNVGLVNTIREVENDLASAQNKIVEMMQAEADGSSVSSGAFSGSFGSSASVFSFIPPSPKIFHGRDGELAQIVEVLVNDASPAVVILGPGGIGKTSLARAVLHHPEILQKYPPGRCVFAACDPALNAEDILALVATQLGLKRSRNLRGDLTSYARGKDAHLFVLDNLETVWEPTELRHEVENILAFLAALENIALLVTMRGAERPSGVLWTRPFLPPLDPLDHDAARQTLLDLADEPEASEQDLNMILAGVAEVLARWHEEKTAAFSDGIDKRTNLDVSITLSLTSPRMRSNPDAQELLRILVLPDGLADGDLNSRSIPIGNILACRTTLLRTSLAYISPAQRLSLLVPIREYIKVHLPPPVDLIHPIFLTYLDLLALFDRYLNVGPVGHLRTSISANFTNIQSLIALRMEGPVSSADAVEILSCGVRANRYSRIAGHGETGFMATSPAKLAKLFVHGDKTAALEVTFIAERLSMYSYKRIPDGPELIRRGLELFPLFDDTTIKCDFHLTISYFAHYCDHNMELAESSANQVVMLSDPGSHMRAAGLRRCAEVHKINRDFNAAASVAEEAQRVFRQNADLYGEASALGAIAGAYCNLGDYRKAADAAVQGRFILSLCELPGGIQDLMLLSDLAEIYRCKSEYAEGRASCYEIFRLSPPTGEDNAFHIPVLLNLAVALDESRLAQDWLATARHITSRLNWKVGLTMCDAIAGVIHLYQGHGEDGRTILEHTFNLGQPEVQRFCLEHLADYNFWTDEVDTSTWAYILLANISRGKGSLQPKRLLYKALQFLGRSMFVRGDTMSAKNLLRVALDGFKELEIHRSIAECLLVLAEISTMAGDSRYSRQLLDSARTRFERSGMLKRVDEVSGKMRGIEVLQGAPSLTQLLTI
ncbi:hypothetical protein MKEN_00396100 [Mycena kentingensis (nom. inval.)]|nr:hypothetical protein MKEN_00396100 [Mycena kentingensis (nom. inval.)]